MSKGLGLGGDWPKEASGIIPGEAREQVIKLFMNLSGNDGRQWLHWLDKFNRGENLFGHLHFVGTISIPACSEKFNPKVFFVTGVKLYAGDGFWKHILPAVSLVKSTPKAIFTAFDLQKPLTDDEIRAELRDCHVFEDVSIFCAHLAEMLKRQKNGEKKEDGLLVNGYASIFYVRGVDNEIFVVHTYWRAGLRGWDVRVVRLGIGCWDAGCRVFSNNNLPTDLPTKAAA
jgi:hypothetical protein